MARCAALVSGLVAVVALGVGAAATPDGDYTIKPPYTPAPELTVRPGVPKGTVHQFVMKSEDSKYYPGISKAKEGVVPYERPVNVYVPTQYKTGTPAPFIVVQDGNSPRYRDSLPIVLDNMIHDKRLPAMVAVMVHHGGGDGRGSERGLEYDTVSDKYAMFIENEVLPRTARDYNITFTKDPEGRATMGGSSGAACAFTMAWSHPELYRKVLSYSGTYVDQQFPYDAESPRGAWEYHATIVPGSPVKPIRIWMHVGQNDNGAARDEASLHNWVLANERMAAVLKAKGYRYRYVYAEQSGHTPADVINHTLPEALEYLWQDYRRN